MSLQDRILVVDENPDLRQLRVEMLIDHGYDVEDAKDGADGWETLQERYFDLVITENTMPKLTGVEVIEKLRSARMTAPVIMATGHTTTIEFARKPRLKPEVTLIAPFPDGISLAAIERILRNDGGDDIPSETLLPKYL
jgi:DNA-binding response OmpR family regulator